MNNVILKYWKAFRLNEIILMSGFFIIGSFFSIEEFNLINIFKLIALFFTSIFTILFVYSFNTASGYKDDLSNIRLKNLWGVNSKLFNKLAILFAAIALLISVFLNHYIPIFVLIIIILWVLYSHPKYGFKRKAVYGTLIHFIAQILHFNMAYLLFKDISYHSILISLFFAIAFSTGHLFHEVIDYSADKKVGLQTSAIKFGIKKVNIVNIILLAINSLLLLYLFTINIIDIAFYCFLIPSLVHFAAFIICFNKVADKALKIRTLYRLVYLLGGLVFLVHTIVFLII